MGQPYDGSDPDVRDPGRRDDRRAPYPQAHGSRRPGSPDPYGQPNSLGLYPPLGYAPDGTALFRPGQPTNTELNLAERAEREARDAEARAEAAADSTSGSRIPKVSTSTLMVGLGVVVLVVIAFVGLSGLRNSAPERPVAEPPLITDTMPDPRTFEPPRLTPPEPGTPSPGQPGGRVDAENKPVTYEATIDGQATILYVDDAGLRSEFAPSNPWTVEFTGGVNPLRLLVIAGTGSGARCSISVDGEVVVQDTVSSSSARRTASCIA
ncbi:hypothetical protein GDN83_21880 [Gordonia jinghuaiqii]|uniref:Uncharacterized protein n=1 Tax=Gordonia jinghuaiqii TaxID=2758710 RepID=A0A7D7QXQ6_9ACTN|nr:hypothetical protein [Gordonia jinghuaiqii]MCR5980349.1 hypothetical protein [Gordonia jinghuaiqii]QMT01909.1 hypothetical protein H1R19_01525 [Gordonia jinghuaiqii]